MKNLIIGTFIAVVLTVLILWFLQGQKAQTNPIVKITSNPPSPGATPTGVSSNPIAGLSGGI